MENRGSISFRDIKFRYLILIRPGLRSTQMWLRRNSYQVPKLLEWEVIYYCGIEFCGQIVACLDGIMMRVTLTICVVKILYSFVSNNRVTFTRCVLVSRISSTQNTIRQLFCGKTRQKILHIIITFSFRFDSSQVIMHFYEGWLMTCESFFNSSRLSLIHSFASQLSMQNCY